MELFFGQKNFDVSIFLPVLDNMIAYNNDNIAKVEQAYEIENILVVDAGRYGFVKLQYYRPPQGFEDAITFTDSRSMFENLWEEWLDTQFFLLAKGTPMAGMGYHEIFRCLPKEKQEELMNRKAGFAKTAGIE